MKAPELSLTLSGPMSDHAFSPAHESSGPPTPDSAPGSPCRRRTSSPTGENVVTDFPDPGLLLEAGDLLARRERRGGGLEPGHGPPEQQLRECLVVEDPPAGGFEAGGQRVESGVASCHGLAEQTSLFGHRPQRSQT